MNASDYPVRGRKKGAHGKALCLGIAGTFLLGLGIFLPPRLSEPKMDFGEVMTGHQATKVLTVANPSIVPLSVSAVFSSCSCTRVFPEALVVAPFATRELKVSLYRKQQGAAHTQIMLITQGLRERRHLVNVTADVISDWDIAPQLLDFDEVDRRASPTVAVLLTPLSKRARDTVALEAKCSDAWIGCSGLPGNPNGPRQFVVRLLPRTICGPMRSTIVFHSETASDVELPVSCRSTGDMYAVPDSLLIGEVPKGDVLRASGRIGWRNGRLGKVAVKTPTLPEGLEVKVELDSSGAFVASYRREVAGPKMRFETRLRFEDTESGEVLEVPVFGIY